MRVGILINKLRSVYLPQVLIRYLLYLNVLARFLLHEGTEDAERLAVAPRERVELGHV